jgi:predicted nucleic acid-binding protein
MNIIIDANIIFSALIKDSLTRRLILEYGDFFLFPSYVFVELNRHKSLLLKKSKMKDYEFNDLLDLILKKC